jgi:hypothetical protein
MRRADDRRKGAGVDLLTAQLPRTEQCIRLPHSATVAGTTSGFQPVCSGIAPRASGDRVPQFSDLSTSSEDGRH